MFSVKYKVNGKPRNHAFHDRKHAENEVEALISTAQRHHAFRVTELRMWEERLVASYPDPQLMQMRLAEEAQAAPTLEARERETMEALCGDQALDSNGKA